MGRKTGSRHAGVFLLELMISILLFSLHWIRQKPGMSTRKNF